MENVKMVMVDPQLFQSEWFVNLPVDDRYMYLYLLMMSDNKIGTIEWNERMINFCANTTKHYTKEDILRIYGNRIQEVPNHPNTLIIVSYLKFNWLKDGRTLDPCKNLDKSILKQLARYDLTVDALNEMEGKGSRITVKEAESDTVDCVRGADVASVRTKKLKPSVSDADVARMFDAFWKAYPSIRRVERKKCSEKFAKILRGSEDAVALFNRIMDGLEKWKEGDHWTKDGGAFVCMPYRWLHNEWWNDEPTKGVANGNTKRRGGTANANYTSSEAEGAF